MFRSQCLHAQWGWKEPECCKTGKKYHFFIITLETMVYSLRTPAFQLNFCVLIFFFFFVPIPLTFSVGKLEQYVK